MAKGCILKSDDVDIVRVWINIDTPFNRVVLIFNQKISASEKVACSLVLTILKTKCQSTIVVLLLKIQTHKL